MTTENELFDWQIKVQEVRTMPTITDPEQLVPVTFELYPAEVLEAAAQALGDKKLNSYAIKLYEYAIKAKLTGALIKVTQLNGVLLTQTKLDNWLASVSAKTLLKTGVPEEVFMAYARFHKARVEESEAVLEKLRKMLGVE